MERKFPSRFFINIRTMILHVVLVHLDPHALQDHLHAGLADSTPAFFIKPLESFFKRIDLLDIEAGGLGNLDELCLLSHHCGLLELLTD